MTWNVVWWDTQFNLGDNITFNYRTELSSDDIYTFTPEQQGVFLLSEPHTEYALQIFEEDEGSIYFEWQNTLENNINDMQMLILSLEDPLMPDSQAMVWQFLLDDLNENGLYSFDLDYDELRQGMSEWYFGTRDFVIHWDVIL